MGSQKALKKINLQSRGDVFLMSEYEPEKILALKVLDIKQNKSYIGQYSEIDLRTQAALIRLTYKDFINKIIKAFFETSLEECNFIYSLDGENGNYVFRWKSIDREETVINLGHIPMAEQDYVSVITELLLNISKEMHELNLRKNALDSDLNESKNQTKKALDQLNKAIEVKENQEREIFTKFALVLNAKKKKLCELSGSNCSDNLSKIKTNGRSAKLISKKFKPHVLSSSEEEEEYEDIIASKPGPSTCMKRNSLFFDDAENESVVPVKSSKIRNRKPIINKRSSSPDQREASNPDSIATFDIDNEEFLIHNL